MIIDCNKDYLFDTKGDPALVSGAQVEQPALHGVPVNALRHRPAPYIS